MREADIDGEAPPQGRRRGDQEIAQAEPSAGVARETMDLYRLLVENIRDYAVFALDPNGYILTWNSAARRFKGYEAEEIIGKHFSVFYPQADIDAGKPDAELEEAIREGRFEEEGWRLRKDGSRFWANVVISPLLGPAGELVGFAKVTRDLTERREAQIRSLEDARRIAAAEAANRAKAEFLAAMSHELRTPLNAIGGYVDLISLGIRGPVTEQQIDDLKRIRRSQQHLLGIINDLLNFSRIESGRLTYDTTHTPLGEIFDAVAAMIEPVASSRNIATVWPKEARTTVYADRAKVEQILMNVLTNALKFTPPGGGITVSCKARRKRVSIHVSDTGSGIAEDKQDAIFEPFVQVGRTHTSPHEGTGLGLAISRDLARAMGGDLTVRSEVGVGSTFTIVLPRGPTPPEV